MSKWSSLKKEENYKISEESALVQVRELLDFYRVDIDEIEDPQQQSSLALALNRLARAYRRGALENLHADGRFKIVQHLEAPTGDAKEIVYDELQGKHKTAMDGLPAQAYVARQQTLLGSLSGLGADAIRSLRSVDLSTAECLAFVFFMA